MRFSDIVLALFTGSVAGLLTWHLTNPHYSNPDLLGLLAAAITIAFLFQISWVERRLNSILAELREKS